MAPSAGGGPRLPSWLALPAVMPPSGPRGRRRAHSLPCSEPLRPGVTVVSTRVSGDMDSAPRGQEEGRASRQAVVPRHSRAPPVSRPLRAREPWLTSLPPMPQGLTPVFLRGAPGPGASGFPQPRGPPHLRQVHLKPCAANRRQTLCNPWLGELHTGTEAQRTLLLFSSGQ